VGIGIHKTNATIGIPASVISVRYRSKKCRTASFYSGTGSVPASLVFLSPVPDWLDAGHFGIPVVSIAVVSIAVVIIAVVSIAVVSIAVPVVSFAVVSIAVVSLVVVSLAVVSMAVVSIAVVSIAVVSIAVVSIAVVSIAAVSITVPVVSIAAVSIAEAHHAMRRHCWVALKRKFMFSYSCEKFLLALRTQICLQKLYRKQKFSRKQ
jgi:hypothetical protein